MAFQINLTATGLTGGSLVTLTSQGSNASNKVSFALPGHTHLTPRTLEMLVTPPKSSKDEPGVARSSLRLTRSTRIAEEGCCSAISGVTGADLNLRWNLNQPEAELDALIAAIRGAVWSPEFVAAIKTGMLPTS